MTSTSKSTSGGKRTRTHRNMRARITKKNRPSFQTNNITFKTFKNIKNRHLPQKGVVYSIEKPEVFSRDTTMKGDIIKKYVDGKLVSQKFVTQNKFLELLEKYKKMLFGGAAPNPNDIRPAQPVQPAEPTVVYVEDRTTFAQSLKTGFAFAFAFNIIEWLFGNNE
jgi:hypothetical protein